MKRINKLKEVRTSQGLTMQALSTMASVSTSSLVAIERYGYYPRERLRKKVAEALKVDESALWPEEE